MEKEELKQVTSFTELKALDLVVYINCRWCLKSHRGLLMRLKEGTYFKDGRFIKAIVWTVSPPPHPDIVTEFGTSFPGPGEVAVNEGRVFIVNTGLETDLTLEVVRKELKEVVYALERK